MDLCLRIFDFFTILILPLPKQEDIAEATIVTPKHNRGKCEVSICHELPLKRSIKKYYNTNYCPILQEIAPQITKLVEDMNV